MILPSSTGCQKVQEPENGSLTATLISPEATARTAAVSHHPVESGNGRSLSSHNSFSHLFKPKEQGRLPGEVPGFPPAKGPGDF